MPDRQTVTGGREATGGVIMGRWALSVGMPDTGAPRGFRWTKLTDVARLESGHTPSRKQPEYWDGDLPWIGVRDATGNHGRTLMDTQQHVTQLGIENSSARVLPKGTVCLSRTASVGYVVLMGRPMATSQDFVNWVCGTELNPLYLKFLLQIEQESIRRFAHGTTHQTMYYPEAKALHVCLPTRAEQDRIAGVLGALDDLIEVNERLVRDLRSLALARHCELAAIATQSLPLKDLVTVNGSQTKSTSTGTLTYLDIASVGDGFVDWPAAMDWESAPSRARRLASEGSTIWSTVRPNRRAHALLTHVPDDLVVSTGFVVLEPKVIGAAEIFCATNGDEFVDYLMSRADGSAYPAVRGSVFEEAALPYLGPDTSEEFEKFAWPLLFAAGELAEESRQLAATRDELLPLLLSGQVRVKDVAA